METRRHPGKQMVSIIPVCLIQAVQRREIKADIPQGGGSSASRMPLDLNRHINFSSGEH